jgi:hypothetical protein
MISLRMLVLGVSAIGVASFASASIIDFEGHPDDGSTVITANDFTFTFSSSGWGVFTDGFSGGGAPYTHNGTTRLMMSGDRDGHTTEVLFKPTDDSAFSLQRLDGATMFPDTEGGMEVIGNLEGGGTVSASFDLADSFVTYVLPGTFVNLDSVLVRNLISGGFREDSGVSLDNIVVNAPVPEPASIAAVGLGLAALARRRRSKS